MRATVPDDPPVKTMKKTLIQSKIEFLGITARQFPQKNSSGTERGTGGERRSLEVKSSKKNQRPTSNKRPAPAKSLGHAGLSFSTNEIIRDNTEITATHSHYLASRELSKLKKREVDWREERGGKEEERGRKRRRSGEEIEKDNGISGNHFKIQKKDPELVNFKQMRAVRSIRIGSFTESSPSIAQRCKLFQRGTTEENKDPHNDLNGDRTNM